MLTQHIWAQYLLIGRLKSELNIDTDGLLEEALRFMFIIREALEERHASSIAIDRIEMLKEAMRNTSLKNICEYEPAKEGIEGEYLINIFKNFLKTL